MKMFKRKKKKKKQSQLTTKMGDQSHQHLPLYAGLCASLLTSYDFNLEVILFMTRWWLSDKESCLIPKSGRFSCRREWQPIPVFWPGEINGQRRLENYSS